MIDAQNKKIDYNPNKLKFLFNTYINQKYKE